MATAPISHVHSPVHASRKHGWTWIVVAVGYFLPAIVGVCVRQYLASIGKPVMSWGWVAQEFTLLAVFSLIWVLPFVLVALLAGWLSLAEIKYRGFVYGAFVGTAVSEIIIFIQAWWNVEAIFLGFLEIPVLVLGGTVLGGALGFLVGYLVGRLRH
ncbi:MAG: hypothetical protein WBR10_08245 [Candidatus Acidiferrum sp.]